VIAGLFVAVSGVPAGAGDRVDDAGDRVASAEAAADAAATRYFDALEQFESLGAQLDAAQAQIDVLDERTDDLRVELRRRAAIAYRTAGSSSFELVTGGMDAARRSAMLGELNDRDERITDELETGIDDLEDQQAELARVRDEQAAALERFRAEQAQLDATLADAQGDYSTARAARAARRAAAVPDPTAPPDPVVAPPATEPPGGQPAEPPTPNYNPQPGVHPHHDDPFLACTRARESGGNYQAINPAGPYLGAYQFLQSTWNSTANNAGRPGLIGVDPRNASQYDQDDMAWTLYQWQGKGPWGGYC
jgi:hypothetical protein